MPPKKRTTEPADQPAKPNTDEPCTREECFPTGHPEDAYTVGCVHGTWIVKR